MVELIRSVPYKKKKKTFNSHVGTTYWATETQTKQLTKSQNFENLIKIKENNVVLSSIISQKHQFNKEAKELNENLKNKCEEFTANTAS